MIRAPGLALVGTCFVVLAGSSSGFPVQPSSAPSPAVASAGGSGVAGVGHAGSAAFAAARAIATPARSIAPSNLTTPATNPPRVIDAQRGNAPLTVIPAVTSVTPNVGPSGGGTNVVIAGSGFTDTTDVFFDTSDEAACPSGGGACFTFVSDTEIDAATPAKGAGSVDVTVQNPAGTSPVNPPGDQFTFVDPPAVTNVTPSSGPSAGGGSVVIAGSNFDGATDVFVDTTGISNPCPGSPCFSIDSPTQITVNNFPGLAPGTVDVTVMTAGGTSAITPADRYTFIAAPTVTNVAPDAGPIAGGNAVILTGTGFSGATDVFVAGADVTGTCPPAPCFTVNSATQITVEVPSHVAVDGTDITVQTAGGTSGITSNDQYSYVAIPTVTNVSPSIGPTGGGNTVTITGTTFESVGNWSASSIFIGSSVTTQCPGSPGAPCFTPNNPTSITVSNVPAHAAGAVDITVTTPGGTSTASGNGTYTFATLPTVTGVSPPAGPAGVVTDTVTLTGTAFMSTTFTTSDVFFGTLDITASPCPGSPSSPCFTVMSATQIVVQAIPAHAAATVDITVQTPLGTSAAAPPGDTFAWAPVPTVTNVSPNNGSTTGGITVVVTGTGFASGANYSATSMMIGTSIPCAVNTCFVVNSPTQITIASIPGSAVGGQDDITVTTIGGTSAPNPPRDVFTYIANLPTVSSVSPSRGATSGLAIVTITGTNYGALGSGFNPTAVTFGSLPPVTTTPCPSSSPTSPCFTRLDANRISVATPPATNAGSVNVTVTTGAGTSTNAVPYTYVAPGAYTALTPYRICDTRAAGTHTECSGLTLTGSRHTITVQITGVVVNAESVPANAQAVVVNLTAINHSAGADFISAFPAGTATPNVSNINVDGGRVQANLAVVALSASGAITVYNPIGSVDVLVDVAGYFAKPTGQAGTFHTFPPVRICDTRANTHTECATTANRPLGPGRWSAPIVVSGVPPGSTGVGIPAGTTAASVVLNLTAVGPTAATFLSVTAPNSSDQCPTKGPTFSNLNPRAGETESNRVISPLGPREDICVFNGAGSVNFIVDINGWFGNGTESTLGALFYAVPPTRICDTRVGSGTPCAGRALTAGLPARVVSVAGVFVIPAFAAVKPPIAVVANLTGVFGSATTYLQLYPSDAPRPSSSDLNPAARDVVANLAVVSLATTGLTTEGRVDLYNAAGTINALLDVAGWFQ
ncbi:MAG: IPT/TIG domain-containing protein [Candidatus Dormiibacterota bacterium]